MVLDVKGSRVTESSLGPNRLQYHSAQKILSMLENAYKAWLSRIPNHDSQIRINISQLPQVE